MSVLSAEMAFEVGDVVYFKTTEHSLNKYPAKFIVIERFVQQCHGGIQRQYKLGPPCEAADRRLITEIELTRECPPFNMAAMLSAAKAEEVIENMRHEAQEGRWKRREKKRDQLDEALGGQVDP